MKNKFTYLLSLVAFLLVFSISSCKHDHGPGRHTHAPDGTKIDKSGKEYTSAFICPMHCKGSGSEAEGTCPVCTMKYVPKDGKKDAHKGHDHSGHDHSGHDHSGHDHSGHDHSGHDH